MTDWLDLYPRTTRDAAEQIARSRAMTSKENTTEAFFSTHPDTASTDGYGEAVVHVRIPADWVEAGWARLDDEFELDDGTWEEHYAIQVARLAPEHFVD
ncbi:hypothetical protein [Leekyejoonella antrihumi]|uniref:Uncharacterized protein n=1 Tax=Leekyejoonella antrihumi TaxID=1660198 RepID=A0A563DRX7_9MICO|nr:hypothetical protein [Leekyejoonella antrihumi]TWP33007.1 hypothetical protein FGL98_22695 [Leekyejoonella antrihumi]